MSGEEYVTVRIPKELADEIDKLIGKYGFRTRAEIVKEAVRRLLAQYKDMVALHVTELRKPEE